MPYVKRDSGGRIVAVFTETEETGLEEVANDDPEVIDFLYQQHSGQYAMPEWLESDLSLARVLEDLIDLLIEKKHIMFTDFPEMAQKKLLARSGLRKEFSYVETLFSPDDEDYSDDDGEGGEFL